MAKYRQLNFQLFENKRKNKGSVQSIIGATEKRLLGSGFAITGDEPGFVGLSVSLIYYFFRLFLLVSACALLRVQSQFSGVAKLCALSLSAAQGRGRTQYHAHQAPAAGRGSLSGMPDVRPQDQRGSADQTARA
ncbi:MAG: hypothetical protein Q7J46_08320 [Pseudomonas sp.]|nr:hypothetical protein [Pseudomonas sp.]